MSIVPYNATNEIVYHDPNHGILVLHDNQENTVQLVSTSNESHNQVNSNLSNDSFPRSRFNLSSSRINLECPSCGFKWAQHGQNNDPANRKGSDALNELMNAINGDPQEAKAIMKNFPQGFMHHDYFKLLGKLPYASKPKVSIKTSTSLPENIFNQGYFKRFFKKVPPYSLGSGAHAQVYKVVHVLNDIKLGTYAVKRISIGDKIELLEQVLNEVLILYELSVQGANENNLIRYNHVWLELGDIQDLKTYFLPNDRKPTYLDNKIPYVFILQQYCDGGHLEDLICKTYQQELHLSMKEQVDLERLRRRESHKHGRSLADNHDTANSKKWLEDLEIWKFFRDVTNGVHYLHLHGILHRDLKPSNCLLDVKYSDVLIESRAYSSVDELNFHLSKLPKILVSDFGEGQFIDKHNIATEDISIKDVSNCDEERRGNTGTLEFTAPELWLFSNYDPSLGNEKQYYVNEFTYESDIYSLGLILCWLCTGTLPFSHIIGSDSDPQVIRNRIIEWYFNLTATSFHEWFISSVQKVKDHEGGLGGCTGDFEKLIYLMIKGDDSSEPFGARPHRLLSGDVVKFLDAMKWKRFLDSYVAHEEEQQFNRQDLIPKRHPLDSVGQVYRDQSDEAPSDDENIHNLANSDTDEKSANTFNSPDNKRPTTALHLQLTEKQQKLFNACIIVGYMLNTLLFDIFDYQMQYNYRILLKVSILLLFAIDLLILRSPIVRASCLVSALSTSFALLSVRS